ncbi:baseplate J/gp47 family protein [Vibrio mimicus]
MSNNRFPTLPEPEIIRPDFDSALASLKERYNAETGHYPTLNDPETAHLEQIAYEKNEVIDAINYESKQNLPAFASGARLEHLAALVGAGERLDESRASTVIQLNFSAPHAAAVVPQGWQVMAVDNKTIFECMQEYIVKPTDTVVLANFECTTKGVGGNGFIAGQISTIVSDDIIGLQSVENITTSQGGAPAEDDDAYAYRIWLAPSSWSACGPYDAYEFFALSASSAIGSVSIWNPAPNEVYISAILLDGTLPEQPIKDAILAQCSGEKRVPMGDLPSVVDVTETAGSATIALSIYKDYASLGSNILDTAIEKVETELLVWKTTHGHDIVVQTLEALCKSIEGVYYAEVHVLDNFGNEINEIKSISKTERANISLVSSIYQIVDEYSTTNFQ